VVRVHLAQQRLGATVGQLELEHGEGTLAALDAGPGLGGAHELVGGEVHVAVEAGGEGVGPVDAGVADDDGVGEVLGVEEGDAVGLHQAVVDVAVAVRLHAVRDARLPEADDRGLRGNFGVGAAVAEAGGRDAEEVVAEDGLPVEGLAVGGEGDAVGARGLVGEGTAGSVAVDGLAPDVGDELAFGGDLGGVVEVAPRLVGAEVDDDEAGEAVRGGVGDVGDALAGLGDVGAQVEADVVEVGVRVGDVLGEEDGVEDGVGGEVDADQLGATVGQGDLGAVRGLGAAGVEDPGAVGGVDDDGLRADPVVAVVGTGRGVGGVVDGAARRVVEGDARVGDLGVVGEELADGVLAVGAVVGDVGVEAGGEVGEEAAGLGDGDTWAILSAGSCVV